MRVHSLYRKHATYGCWPCSPFILKVPELLKGALKILYGKDITPKEIQAYLPIKLNAIDQIAQNCEKEAEKVVKDFETVIETLVEFQKQTLLLQGKTEEAKKLNTLQIKMQEESQKFLDERRKEKENDIANLKDKVSEAHRDWKEAMETMPGTGALIGAAIVDGLSSTFSALAGSIQMTKTSVVAAAAAAGETASGGFRRVFPGGRSQQDTRNFGEYNESEDEMEVEAPQPGGITYDLRLFEVVTQFSQVAQGLLSCFEETDDKVGLTSQENAVQKAKEIGLFLKKKQKEVNPLQQSKKKDKLGKLISECVNITKDIQKKPSSPEDIEKAFNSLKEVISQSSYLCAEGNKRLGIPQFQKSGPQAAGNAPMPQGKSLVSTLVENAQVKVESTRAELNSLREASDKAKQEGMEVQNKLRESMMNMEKFQNEAATQEEILQIMEEALKAFSELNSQWKILKEFFIDMSTLIRASMSPQINQFVKEADVMQKLGLPSAVAKENIYQTAYQAVKVAHVVNHLSDSYCTISKGYLMPLTGELDKMISLRKEKDKAEISRKRSLLGDEANKAQRAIEDIIRKKHATFQMRCNDRMKAIDAEMNKLPALPEKKRAEIQAEATEMVKQVNQEIDLDEYC